MRERDECPPIADYALIGDCRGAALVSRTGSIDWCCMPRMDRGASFARLLDWPDGGCCTIAPRAGGHDDGEVRVKRRYLDGTLVLETTFATPDGEVRLLDCMTLVADDGGDDEPQRVPRAELLRVVEGVRGRVVLDVRVAPRFTTGSWRRGSATTATAPSARSAATTRS